MIKSFQFLLVLATLTTISSAQTISTQTFGSGDNAFSMEFVEIGNPGNAADTTGSPSPAGAVSYRYNIGKYEVSKDMIDKANASGFLGITLIDMSDYGGNGVNRPAGVSWYDAARYVNWLNTSNGFVPAYKFDANGNFQLWSAEDAGYNANNNFRNSLAKYVIASRDEWYKAAYGNPNGSWSNFPNGSDSAPAPVAGGTAANTAVFSQSTYTGPADIANAGGLSVYGTMGQGGNVWEWTETVFYGNNDTVDKTREIRGGNWLTNRDYLAASPSTRRASDPTYGVFGCGFRVAVISQPSSTLYLYLFTTADQTKGAVTVSPIQSSYLAGDLVTISGSPQPGYVFSAWTGDISGTTASVTVTMDSNKSITANFGQDTRDSDTDGLSNYQEIITYGTNPNQKDSNADGVEDGHAVSMGYSPTLNFSALIAHPPTGLYTASQMQAMAIGNLVLTKNANGSFVLDYDIEQSTDLQTWTPYQALSLPLTGLPADKAFIRIKAK